MFPELKIYDHELPPLPMQNPYSKLILGLKFYLLSDFQNAYSTYYDKF